jgi:hypothetical protein
MSGRLHVAAVLTVVIRMGGPQIAVAWEGDIKIDLQEVGWGHGLD